MLMQTQALTAKALLRWQEAVDPVLLLFLADVPLRRFDVFHVRFTS